MSQHTESLPTSSGVPDEVHLPTPTPWPLLLALGITLIATGLLSSYVVCAIGTILAVISCVGWFVQVLPHEREKSTPVLVQDIKIASSRRGVAHAETSQTLNRVRLPLEVYPVSAGIKGGLAGAGVMALMAMFYGIVSHRSVWYPVNLLGAVVYARVQVSSQEMESFHVGLFLVAIVLHLTTSLLVGLLYGTLLPMLSRRPILLGGLFAPLAWAGLLHGVLDIVDPTLNQNINWFWFLISQIAFGLVAGLVVVRQVRIPVWQYPSGSGIDQRNVKREDSPTS